ncbi:DUF1638 domain-containing protein [Sporomusa sphaeroides DSM 2875]|uniref:DUF1638 domain-containing protein n=1 Tax=Sporomusa sphaeroides TaxID=47679 RepID=UPI00202FEECD|nr:DUF1638 domain-containing protein [Sporomusa sphaeroides]MCM0760967.1 DUF1638 domain-containing protein [Sporomusa sphaeroides DSM 2875]
MTKLLCCEILRAEIEQLLKTKQDVEIQYLEAGLHADLKKMENAIKTALDGIGNSNDVLLGFGSMCHPELEIIAANYGVNVLAAKNCIEILLGDKLKELDAESRTFYITSGWLENWRKIFIEQLKWDKIDARQNFGFYERIVLLDTGLIPLEDEAILEFFEYTEVPIEIVPVDLDNLKKLLFTHLK